MADGVGQDVGARFHHRYASLAMSISIGPRCNPLFLPCFWRVTNLRGNIRCSKHAIDLELVIPCAGVFIFVGVKPHTDWLPGSVGLDNHEFILTGPSILGSS